MAFTQLHLAESLQFRYSYCDCSTHKWDNVTFTTFPTLFNSWHQPHTTVSVSSSADAKPNFKCVRLIYVSWMNLMWNKWLNEWNKWNKNIFALLSNAKPCYVVSDETRHKSLLNCKECNFVVEISHISIVAEGEFSKIRLVFPFINSFAWHAYQPIVHFFRSTTFIINAIHFFDYLFSLHLFGLFILPLYFLFVLWTSICLKSSWQKTKPSILSVPYSTTECKS